MKFVVRKDMKIPEPRGRHPLYPWNELDEVGACFLVPLDVPLENGYGSVKAAREAIEASVKAAVRYRNRDKSRQFVVRRVPEENAIGVWRVK